MKYTFIFCLFLIPALCYGQAKKDSKIIVTIADTSNLTNKIIEAFHDKEFTVDERGNGFISTKEKSIKAGFPTEVKLRARVKDNTVIFTGEMRVNISVMGQPPTYDQIQFWGVKKSAAKLSWEEMLDVAKKLDGKITYEK